MNGNDVFGVALVVLLALACVVVLWRGGPEYRRAVRAYCSAEAVGERLARRLR